MVVTPRRYEYESVCKMVKIFHQRFETLIGRKLYILQTHKKWGKGYVSPLYPSRVGWSHIIIKGVYHLEIPG
jgi:hypothetical protein